MELIADDLLRDMRQGGKKGRRLFLKAWLMLHFGGHSDIAEVLRDRVIPELKESFDRGLAELLQVKCGNQ
jgi:hypothetical protein